MATAVQTIVFASGVAGTAGIPASSGLVEISMSTASGGSLVPITVTDITLSVFPPARATVPTLKSTVTIPTAAPTETASASPQETPPVTFIIALVTATFVSMVASSIGAWWWRRHRRRAAALPDCPELADTSPPRAELMAFRNTSKKATGTGAPQARAELRTGRTSREALLRTSGAPTPAELRTSRTPSEGGSATPVELRTSRSVSEVVHLTPHERSPAELRTSRSISEVVHLTPGTLSPAELRTSRSTSEVVHLTPRTLSPAELRTSRSISEVVSLPHLDRMSWGDDPPI